MIQTQTATCVHCGQPAIGNDEQAFCCNGCRVAYELIHGWGLDDFYSLRDSRSSTTPSNTIDDLRYDSFDDDAFLGRSAPTVQADGLMSAELAIRGLHCAACAWLIENAAARTPGWNVARVKMNSHTLRVLFDPQLVKLSQIARLTGRLGYELAPLTGNADQHIQRENRYLLIQIAIAGFCAANAMWIGIALYAGDASGVLASYRNYLRLIGTGLGIIAVAFPGRTFFAGAIASLRTRTPHMDLPVALGLFVGTVIGTINAVIGRGDVYFDSLAVLVFLLLIGRWIQFRQQYQAAKSVDLLLRITPQHAQRKTGPDQYSLVMADTLEPNDIVRVDAGQSIPVDGQIERGETLIDRSLLTGESQPITTSTGDEVCAGTVNLSHAIEIRVAAIGGQSRIGRVMKSVEEAMADKIPVVQLADRVGGVFVVVVTLLACATFVLWSGSGWHLAASNATSLLIVACPCALALATPLAVAVSLGRAANRRILIRDGGAFQQLAKPGQIWFDKTGTLTEGRITAQFVSGSVDAIAYAAAIETECCHPIADAVIRLATERNLDDRSPTLSRTLYGGVLGQCDGHEIVVGNLVLMESEQVSIDNQVQSSIDAVTQALRSPILIAVDGRATTVLEVSDRLRPNAKTLISQLTSLGWKVGMLSGDHPVVVQRVAEELGIPVERSLGGISPEEKLRTIRESGDEKIVMVGDGANDAAALAAADVGVAVRGGAEVSLQAAPVFVSSGNLHSIVELIEGSRRVMRLIATAFTVSLGYNMIAVSLAVAGHITPLIAAVLMPISSVSVLALTLSWPTFGGSDS